MPKSSRASRTPSALSSCRRATASSVSSITIASVISSTKRAGSSPDRSSAPRTSATRPGCWSCLAERLTLMPVVAAERAQRARRASCSTQRPDRDDQPGLLGERDELDAARSARARGGASAAAPRRRRSSPSGRRDDGLVVAARARRRRSRAAGRCAAPGGRPRPRASPARTGGSRPCRRAWRCTSRRRRRGAAPRRRAASLGAATEMPTLARSDDLALDRRATGR